MDNNQGSLNCRSHSFRKILLPLAMCQGLLIFKVGEDGFELLVGGGETAATFAQQLGGAAGICREFVYVAGVALHCSEYAVEFTDCLIVCKVFYGSKFHCYFCGLRVVTVDSTVPSCTLVTITAPAVRSLTDVTALPFTRVMV